MLQPAYQWVDDSGPIYRETVEGRFPVEPWNTFSNLIFLVILVHFTYKVWKSEKGHTYLTACLPIILIGYIGGTIYHATRSAEIWLLMDWVPIVLLCVATSIYFAIKGPEIILGKVCLVTVAVGTSIGIRFLPLPEGLEVSLGYVGTALGVLIPIFYFGYRTGWRFFRNILFALATFAAAVIFRSLDEQLDPDIFYMGTHWLWHILGGMASFYVLRYVYLTKEKELA